MLEEEECLMTVVYELRRTPALVSGVRQDVAGAGNLRLHKVTDIWG